MPAPDNPALCRPARLALFNESSFLDRKRQSQRELPLHYLKWKQKSSLHDDAWKPNIIPLGEFSFC
jgi:hypothetical protein